MNKKADAPWIMKVAFGVLIAGLFFLLVFLPLYKNFLSTFTPSEEEKIAVEETLPKYINIVKDSLGNKTSASDIFPFQIRKKYSILSAEKGYELCLYKDEKLYTCTDEFKDVLFKVGVIEGADKPFNIKITVEPGKAAANPDVKYFVYIEKIVSENT